MIIMMLNLLIKKNKIKMMMLNLLLGGPGKGIYTSNDYYPVICAIWHYARPEVASQFIDLVYYCIYYSCPWLLVELSVL